MDDLPKVLKAAGAIPFPRVPDQIFLGDGFIQHVTVSKKTGSLRAAAKKAGMGMLTDRFSKQRQGPLLPGTTFNV